MAWPISGKWLGQKLCDAYKLGIKFTAWKIWTQTNLQWADQLFCTRSNDMFSGSEKNSQRHNAITTAEEATFTAAPSYSLPSSWSNLSLRVLNSSHLERGNSPETATRRLRTSKQWSSQLWNISYITSHRRFCGTLRTTIGEHFEFVRNFHSFWSDVSFLQLVFHNTNLKAATILQVSRSRWSRHVVLFTGVRQVKQSGTQF